MGFSSSQLASASLIGQIGGGVTSAIGSYYSAATQKATLQGQAAVADVNARIAELGAQSALYQGQQQVGAVSLNAGRMKSAQRAAMAANGIDLGVGSAVELQASTDIMKEIDMATIEANAMRSASGKNMATRNPSLRPPAPQAATSSHSRANPAPRPVNVARVSHKVGPNMARA